MRQNNIEPTWGYPGYYLFAILLLTIYRLRCFTPPLAMFVWAPNLNDEAPNVSPSHHCTICCRYCLSRDWFHWALLSGSAPSHSHWNWKKNYFEKWACLEAITICCCTKFELEHMPVFLHSHSFIKFSGKQRPAPHLSDMFESFPQHLYCEPFIRQRSTWLGNLRNCAGTVRAAAHYISGRSFWKALARVTSGAPCIDETLGSDDHVYLSDCTYRAPLAQLHSPLSFAVLIHLTAKTSPRISGCQHALLLLLWSLLKDIQIKKEYM